jgi:hypothetical protein
VLTGHRFPRRNRLGSSCSWRILVSGYGLAVIGLQFAVVEQGLGQKRVTVRSSRFTVHSGWARLVRGMSWFLALQSDRTYMTYRTYMNRGANCKRRGGRDELPLVRCSGDYRDGCPGEPKALPPPIRIARHHQSRRPHHSRTRTTTSTTTSTKDDCRALSNLARAPRTSRSSSLPMLARDDLQSFRCNLKVDRCGAGNIAVQL